MLRKVKMTETCEGCKRYNYCNNNNLLCRAQVLSEVYKEYLEEIYSRGND